MFGSSLERQTSFFDHLRPYSKVGGLKVTKVFLGRNKHAYSIRVFFIREDHCLEKFNMGGCCSKNDDDTLKNKTRGSVLRTQKRGPRGTQGPQISVRKRPDARSRRDLQGGPDPRDGKGPQDGRNSLNGQNQRDRRGPQDKRDSRGGQDKNYERGPQGRRDSRYERHSKGPRGLRDDQDRDDQFQRDRRDPRDGRDSRKGHHERDKQGPQDKRESRYGHRQDPNDRYPQDKRDLQGKRDSRNKQAHKDRKDTRDQHNDYSGRRSRGRHHDQGRDRLGGGRDRRDRNTRRQRDLSGLEAYEAGFSDLMLNDESDYTVTYSVKDERKTITGPKVTRTGSEDEDDYYYKKGYARKDSEDYTTSFDDAIDMLQEPYNDKTRGTSTQTYYGSSRPYTSRYRTKEAPPSRHRQRRDKYYYEDDYDYDYKYSDDYSDDINSYPNTSDDEARYREAPPRGGRYQVLPPPSLPSQFVDRRETLSAQMDPLDKAIRKLGADPDVDGKKATITYANPLSALKARSVMRATRRSLRPSEEKKRRDALKRNPYSLAAVVEEEVLSYRPTSRYCE